MSNVEYVYGYCGNELDDDRRQLSGDGEEMAMSEEKTVRNWQLNEKKMTNEEKDTKPQKHSNQALYKLEVSFVPKYNSGSTSTSTSSVRLLFLPRKL
jgi:hypothetical protein